MTDKFAERYYTATYERRLDAANEALVSIQDNAGYALRDIERGRIPSLRSILDDALKLARAIEAMDALAEMKKVYDSAAPDAEAGQ